MRLMQVRKGRNGRQVVATNEEGSWFVEGFDSVYDLAQAAIASERSIEELVLAAGRGRKANPAALLAAGKVTVPVEHADPAHVVVTGTGLTHLGSAATRDAMHQKVTEVDEEALTDSMKMFRMGLEGGKPKRGKPGVQPEWFYKGDGQIVVPPGAPLRSPDFALDGGEEPELVGLYVIGPDGTPHRLGYALGNEFSDHVTERQNYLYLAHSKLRTCAVGPELRTGPLPADLRGTSRLRRDGAVVWEKPFLTGEANMCHSLENLEYHHFKYAAHRRPGDVHLHFFGTATLSFADGVRAQPGDVFEIEIAELGAPLANPLQVVPAGFAPGGVRAL